MNKKKLIILISIIIALAILACVGIFALSGNKGSKIADKLDLGEKYLEEMEYEKALALYKEILEIDLKNVDAYLGMAEVYLAMGENDRALAILEEGYEETEDARIEANIVESKKLMVEAQVSSGTTQEPEKTSEPELSLESMDDWLTKGIPRSNIKDLTEYTIDGIFLPCLTPRLLLEKYGEYNNTYENAENITSECGIYETVESTGEESYIMNKYGKNGCWLLTSVQYPYWEEIFINGENWEIGFADIYFGDDYYTVMEKLGFTREQADWVKAGISNDDNQLWECYCEGDFLMFDEKSFIASDYTYAISIPVVDERYPFMETGIRFYFWSDYKLYGVSWGRAISPESISR